jgi:hypothetical protein
MIFVRVDTVDSRPALRLATRSMFARSAASSSSLAITVPHSCARTESRNFSSPDIWSSPETTRKIWSCARAGASGNAHQDDSFISSRPGAVILASALLMLSGARS